MASTNPARTEIKSFDDAYKLLSQQNLSAVDAATVLNWMGEGDLVAGAAPTSEDLRFIFGISAPSRNEAKVISDDGAWSVELKQVGTSDLFMAATTLPEGAGFRWSYLVGTTHVGGGELEAYTYPPETKLQDDFPKGVLTEQTPWQSKVFAGTTRHWWIYVPQQYHAAKPACLFVIQDGQWSRRYWPAVLDNMIANKQIPVSIAVFLTPGTIKNDLDNRSIEYDTVSDRYVTMLADEILPELYSRYNIRKDAKGHLITGLSSGGICSFNAAWQRPDLFHKVLSWIGSFANLQGGPTGVAGGNTYPAIIRDRAGWDRKGEPKPIRVFLQDGANDLDNKAGNWPLANQEMAKALEFGRYDYRFVFGKGFHSDKHGRATLPDALQWLWRDEPK